LTNGIMSLVSLVCFGSCFATDSIFTLIIFPKKQEFF
jgi:hypothetical protein